MVSATDIINALSQEVSPGSASATPPPATHATDPAPAYVTDTVTDPFASSAFAILKTPPVRSMLTTASSSTIRGTRNGSSVKVLVVVSCLCCFIYNIYWCVVRPRM